MVQMKVRPNAIRTDAIGNLYIPHGSDESLCDMLMKFHPMTFISHMVQMKGSISFEAFFWMKNFISHMVQMKASMRYANEVPGDDLYIPHGSDERL